MEDTSQKIEESCSCSSPPSHQFPVESVLLNPLLLGTILGKLDLDCLLTARLVSTTWAKEGLKLLRKFDLMFRLQPQHFEDSTSTLAQLESLVTGGRLSHTLLLSFQTCSWRYLGPHFNLFHHMEFDSPEYQAYNKFVLAEHEAFHSLCVASAMNCVAINTLFKIGRFVTELRLEMSLENEKDAAYVVQILIALPKLKICSLDFIAFSNQGFKALSSLGKGLSSQVSVLGIRLGLKYRNHEVLSQIGAKHLMSTFSRSNIETLDLTGWEQYGRVNQDFKASGSYLVEAIASLIHDDATNFARLSNFPAA
ncbi:uncharacterized protein LOC110854362 [Folsomia candida]|uniref:uncharacterized protein LOC110854362 n=1 Tax=Folsomia candida TaxID=158441 RepID=UPI00160558E2|nr:uncharacterized protein LOC110854362 [Folsomia candida]XP_035710736.1 uncharacterized protein LOC110854362 [Folsomia candida]XP_035710737.1 uncharacterized protein LOC110854362 [Folsomia candida]XP_035710738.1 uncharacterized protein LOC110854362 [Folsomia candida]